MDPKEFEEMNDKGKLCTKRQLDFDKLLLGEPKNYDLLKQ